MTQWLRKITVEYGRQIPEGDYGPPAPWSITSEGDSDYRIQFRFNRTNTNTADTGTIAIYNLPPEFLSSIRSGVTKANADRRKILDLLQFKNDLDARNGELRELAVSNLVRVYAGYQDSTKVIFTGDITSIDLNSMRSDVDTVTRIDLGDTVIPLKYGWLNKSFAGGTKLEDLLAVLMKSTGLTPSQMMLKFQNEAIVGVEVAEFKNGLAIMGGVKRNLDAIVARYGVQWFIREGELFLMARGALIDDFSLTLMLGENVLKPVSDLDGDSTSFTMLLDGDMLPGRGFRIMDEFGKPTSKSGYRADTVSYVGDTHGNPWYCMVEGVSIDGKGFPPATTITPDQAFTTTNVAVP
jgi:hypothetical protein